MTSTLGASTDSVQANSNAEESGRINVAVRVRPPFESEIENGSEFHGIIATNQESPSVTLMEPEREFFRTFSFDKIFEPSDSQEYVYNTIGYPVVQDILQGINGTIMAYGQTGTGKTYTMGILGSFDEKNMGLVPRCLDDIFYLLEKERQQNSDLEWSCKLSFLQIYMEMIQDLLNPALTNLPIRESNKNGIIIPSMTSVDIKDGSQAAEIVLKGLKNRSIAPTLMNTTSSRSHTVLALEVTKKIGSREIISKLRLVDLAGSERVNKTLSSGTRLSEAKQINKSLSTLGTVIAALAKKTTNVDAAYNRHIPYRNSKLTRILKDVLEGNSNIYVIATVSSAKNSYYETLSTLTFAQRCTKVQTHATANEKFNDIDYKILAQRLQNQLMALHVKSNSNLDAKMNDIKKEENERFNSQDSEIDIKDASDVSWGLVNALYETLWEIYQVSLYNMQYIIERAALTEKFWQEAPKANNVQNDNDETLKTVFETIQKKYPVKILNYKDNKPMSGTIEYVEELQKQPLTTRNNLEMFVKHVSAIHQNTLGQTLCICKNLEVRDHQLEELKRESFEYLIAKYKLESSSTTQDKKK